MKFLHAPSSVQCEPLPLSFYTRDDVVAVARDLLGKQIITQIDGELAGGMIIETEAYAGPHDRASHAYGGRRTKRTEVMFAEGGIAYLYLCYGMHTLFNVVTGPKDLPHAVLIRAIAPSCGEALMKKRRKEKTPLCDGPAMLSQALGLSLRHNGISLEGPELLITEGIAMDTRTIQASTRIGIDYAGEDALLPWRFRYITLPVMEQMLLECLP